MAPPADEICKNSRIFLKTLLSTAVNDGFDPFVIGEMGLFYSGKFLSSEFKYLNAGG